MKNYYDTDPEFMERFEHFAFDGSSMKKDSSLAL